MSSSRTSLRLLLFCVVVVSSLGPEPTVSSAQMDGTASAVSSEVESRILKNYGNLPLSFEANQGQTDHNVQFLARGRGHQLFLTPSAAVLTLQIGAAKAERSAGDAAQRMRSSSPSVPSHSVVRMTFEGADPQAEVVGLDPLPGIVNYITGGDSSKWRTNIPTYRKVQY